MRNMIDEKLQREAVRPVKPRTTLGRKLLAARAEYKAAGGRALSLDEVPHKRKPPDQHIGPAVCKITGLPGGYCVCKV